jgi:hypothetical protein
MLTRYTAALALSLWAASASAQMLPPDVSERVGRAASFVYNYTPSQYADKLGTRDVVWDNRPTTIQGGAHRLHFPPSTFSSAYTAVNRLPADVIVYGKTRLMTACGVPHGGCPLSWFRSNHPEWIIYKADQVTPAYQFGDTTWVPLDISNPKYRSWLFANYYQPILDLGYQALSVDNVTPRNDFGEVGTCSIAPTTHCTADGGTWTQLYSGTARGDEAFIRNRVEWVRAITGFAHSRNRSTIGNVTYDPVNTKASADLIDAFDVWFDEPGFTGDTNPSPCRLDNPTSVIDRTWVNKVNFITTLNAGAGPKAYITENSICPNGSYQHPGKGSNFEVVEFAVASYLIIKNRHTYLFTYFDNGTTGGVGAFNDETPTARWPQLSLRHGAATGKHAVTGGVYHREFADALAIVNPSRSEGKTFDVGSRAYHRSDCARYSGLVTVPPMTGMVLLKGEPTTCIPAIRFSEDG